MTLKSLCLSALSSLALAGTLFQVGEAREQFGTASLPECERIERALSQYRAFAAKDDGALLPVPDEPIEPASITTAYLDSFACYRSLEISLRKRFYPIRGYMKANS